VAPDQELSHSQTSRFFTIQETAMLFNHPPPQTVKTHEGSGDDGALHWQISGELTPTLTVDVSRVGVYFEHHTLLWKNPTARVSLRPMGGAWRRVFAGMPVFMGQIQGAGLVSFSRGHPGQLIAVHLQPGQSIAAREHCFLAAMSTVDYGFERARGAANWIVGDTGFFVDIFTGLGNRNDPGGAVWLHARGNVFEKVLAAGEEIDLAPGAWLCRDRSVKMQTRLDSLSSGFLGRGGNLIVNRFTGPGRLLFQSGREEMAAGASNAGSGRTAWWMALVALLTAK